MKKFMLASLLMILGSLLAMAQSPEPLPGGRQASPSCSMPDNNWVLQQYPNATNISWHKEKSGQFEFEFMDGTKETKVWFNTSGKMVKTKIESKDGDHKTKTLHREKTDDDDKSRNN